MVRSKLRPARGALPLLSDRVQLLTTDNFEDGHFLVILRLLFFVCNSLFGQFVIITLNNLGMSSRPAYLTLRQYRTVLRLYGFTLGLKPYHKE